MEFFKWKRKNCGPRRRALSRLPPSLSQAAPTPAVDRQCAPPRMPVHHTAPPLYVTHTGSGSVSDTAQGDARYHGPMRTPLTPPWFGAMMGQFRHDCNGIGCAASARADAAEET